MARELGFTDAEAAALAAAMGSPSPGAAFFQPGEGDWRAALKKKALRDPYGRVSIGELESGAIQARRDWLERQRHPEALKPPPLDPVWAEQWARRHRGKTAADAPPHLPLWRVAAGGTLHVTNKAILGATVDPNQFGEAITGLPNAALGSLLVPGGGRSSRGAHAEPEAGVVPRETAAPGRTPTRPVSETPAETPPVPRVPLENPVDWFPATSRPLWEAAIGKPWASQPVSEARPAAADRIGTETSNQAPAQPPPGRTPGIGDSPAETPAPSGRIGALADAESQFTQQERKDGAIGKTPSYTTMKPANESLGSLARIGEEVPVSAEGQVGTQSDPGHTGPGPEHKWILNIGSGTNPMEGAINIDNLLVGGKGGKPLKGVDVAASTRHLPFRDAHFDEAVSVNPAAPKEYDKDGKPILDPTKFFNPLAGDTARVLKPGARLIVVGTPRNFAFRRIESLDAGTLAGFGFERVGGRLPVEPRFIFGEPTTIKGDTIKMKKAKQLIFRRLP